MHRDTRPTPSTTGAGDPDQAALPAPVDPASLAGLSEAARDRLEFGLVTVDRAGRVLHYNAAEARMAGRDPAQQTGRHFFTEVAPCTQVPTVQGAFLEARPIDLPYLFTHGMRPAPVWLSLRYHADLAWVVIQPRGAVPDAPAPPGLEAPDPAATLQRYAERCSYEVLDAAAWEALCQAPSSVSRGLAAFAVGRLGWWERRSWLEAALADPHPWVRECAAWALGQRGAPAEPGVDARLEALLLEDESWQVGRRCALSLKRRLGAAYAQRAQAWLEHPLLPWVRRGVVEGLAPDTREEGWLEARLLGGDVLLADAVLWNLSPERLGSLSFAGRLAAHPDRWIAALFRQRVAGDEASCVH